MMRIAFYAFPPDIRRTVAALVRRHRNTDEGFVESDFALFCLWAIGAFRRSTLAIGVWLDRQWPVVRRGDGRWVALDPVTGRLHELTIRGNLSQGTDYRAVS